MPFKIVRNNDGIIVLVEGWHPVNGKWTHIIQEVKEKEIVYYTNGTEEFRKEIEVAK